MQDTNLKTSSFLAAIRPVTEALGRLDLGLSEKVAVLLRAEDQDFQGNVFERPINSATTRLKSRLARAENHAIKFAVPLQGNGLNHQLYMPIRAFRGPVSRLWPSVDKLWIFHSSGTTSGMEGKSRSGYSPEGLAWYQAASLATFISVLDQCIPSRRHNLLSIRAVSFIPTVAEWPDSSLAQMVAWFAQLWTTHYLDPAHVEKVRNGIAEATEKGEPIYVFGTAFHFVNLLESGVTFSLPSGSIIIETGGTKGRSRSVTREELYQMIATGFGVDPSKIISEYGMCELASQAWDVGDSDFASPPPATKSAHTQSTALHLSNRSFKFPWWVTASVMSTRSDALDSGEGALTIYDPLRIDLGDVAVQTEDLATLKNQTFQLRGRVPRAALKGCSLRVSDATLIDASIPQRTASKAAPIGSNKKISPGCAEIIKNSRISHDWILNLIAAHDSLARLTLELGSEALAREAISDLESRIPRDFDQFLAAATHAYIKTGVCQRWLMIPPSSHSLAFIHPLAQAVALGISVRIRLPAIHGLQPDESFLGLAVDLAQKSGADLVTVDLSWRLGREDLLDGENILVFGDDETCDFMNLFAPGRVSAFDNLVSLTMVNGTRNDKKNDGKNFGKNLGKSGNMSGGKNCGDDFSTQDSLKRMVRDQLSLAQRGCLSSRAIIVIGGDPTKIGESLASSIPGDLFGGPPPIGETVARSMEEVRLLQNEFSLFRSPNSSSVAARAKTHCVTVATKATRLETLGEDLGSGLGRLDLVILVFVLPENTAEMDIISVASKILPLKVVSLGPKLFDCLSKNKNTAEFPRDLQLVKLGTLGSPEFNGQHMGRVFFAT